MTMAEIITVLPCGQRAEFNRRFYYNVTKPTDIYCQQPDGWYLADSSGNPITNIGSQTIFFCAGHIIQ